MKKDSTDRRRVYQRAFSRINKIHKEIASGTFPSGRRLAELCEVDIRTVKRDLEVLRDELNAPLANDRRKKGYYYTLVGWALPPIHLSEGELLAFFIAENALRLTGRTPEAAQLKQSLSKLAELLPDEVSINLTVLDESLSFQNQPFEMSESTVLQRLAESAKNRQTVEFDYYAHKTRKTEHRRVDVYLLHNLGGDWYAVSYDLNRRAMRDFHVGRISNLTLTDDSFTVKKALFKKEEYLRKGFQMIRGGRPTKVEIRFDPFQAQWIRSRKHFHPDERREDLADGSLRLSFEVGADSLEAVARFCLQYAGHCIADKPPKLREIIREKLKKALEMHR